MSGLPDYQSATHPARSHQTLQPSASSETLSHQPHLTIAFAQRQPTPAFAVLPSPPQTFYQFSPLPTELQIQIIKYAAEAGDSVPDLFYVFCSLAGNNFDDKEIALHGQPTKHDLHKFMIVAGHQKWLRLTRTSPMWTSRLGRLLDLEAWSKDIRELWDDDYRGAEYVL